MLTIFGFIGGSLMVMCYWLEPRHRRYTFLMGVLCVLMAVYAYLQGSYPFILVEGAWAYVAFTRWRQLEKASRDV